MSGSGGSVDAIAVETDSLNARPTDAIATPDSASNGTPRTLFPGSPALDGLRTADGSSWPELRRRLPARWGRLWLDIGLRYLMLALGLALACAVAARFGNGFGLVAAPFVAVWMGFWFASIVLFIHEAAHYNLHPDKDKNDRLAGNVICVLIGNDIKHYRAHHWKHHLYLGDTADTEISYHWAPTLRFAIETMVGVHAWRVFRAHRNAGLDAFPKASARSRNTLALARGIVFHGAILLPIVLAGWWSAAVAWALAVLVVFPYLSALRQQLEHRSPDAASDVDYTKVPHGAVNRMFGGDPFARAFGCAGFRRHLLHHWDPSTSYTRFDELEGFLMQTEVAPLIDGARTTYFAAWRVLARG
ncbi:MAG: hypothetical protein FJ144_00490 [Deltaproteobacteria bacterium]|nr:hypothetical protein [Deltaproteobacteria bacterium]